MPRAIILLLALAALIVACSPDDEEFQRPPTAVPPPSLEQTAMDLGGTPMQLLEIAGQLLVADIASDRLLSVDESGISTAEIVLAATPDLIASDGEFVFAWSRESGHIAMHRIDGSLVRTVDVEQELSSLHAWGGRAWGVAAAGDQLIAVSPADVDTQTIGPMTGAGRAGSLNERLWVPLERELRVVGLDSEGAVAVDFSAFDGPSNAYLTPDQPGPTAVFAGNEELWVAYREVRSVVAFRTNGTITGNLGVTVAPDLLAISDSGLLIASTGSATVEYVDMRTLQRVIAELPGPPSDLLYTDGAFWVSIPATGQIVRLAPA